VDEAKAQKLKIGALVLLGVVCLAVAVPRFLIGHGGAKPAHPPATAKGQTAAKTHNAAADRPAAPTEAPYPVAVGQEIVKDPFSSPVETMLAKTKPPPSDPFEGKNWSQQDFPWSTPPGSVRPPAGAGANGGDVPAAVRLPDQGPPLQLTGVLKGSRDVAIIRSDTARYYAGVGDSLGGGYRVVSIAQDRVTLSGPAGTRVLVLGRS
jgi:hypothetical protein